MQAVGVHYFPVKAPAMRGTSARSVECVESRVNSVVSGLQTRSSQAAAGSLRGARQVCRLPLTPPARAGAGGTGLVVCPPDGQPHEPGVLVHGECWQRGGL